jgi:hypothetical protein
MYCFMRNMIELLWMLRALVSVGKGVLDDTCIDFRGTESEQISRVHGVLMSGSYVRGFDVGKNLFIDRPQLIYLHEVIRPACMTACP